MILKFHADTKWSSKTNSVVALNSQNSEVTKVPQYVAVAWN